MTKIPNKQLVQPEQSKQDQATAQLKKLAEAVERLSQYVDSSTYKRTTAKRQLDS